jgi:hypothetical protein
VRTGKSNVTNEIKVVEIDLKRMARLASKELQKVNIVEYLREAGGGKHFPE